MAHRGREGAICAFESDRTQRNVKPQKFGIFSDEIIFSETYEAFWPLKIIKSPSQKKVKSWCQS